MIWFATPLGPIIAAKLFGGGGGSVTAAAVLSAMQAMSDAQAALALAAIDGEPQKLTVNLSGSNPIASDTQFDTIFAALNAGKIVEVVYGEVMAHPVGYDPSAAYFATVSGTSGNLTATIYTIDENDNVTVSVLSPVMPPTTVTVSGTTPTITPAANTVYNCGELASLTISNPPASGAYSIVFTSGSTPTVTTIPATILGLEDFAAEANTVYEINVLDNRAVVGSWAVSA